WVRRQSPFRRRTTTLPLRLLHTCVIGRETFHGGLHPAGQARVGALSGRTLFHEGAAQPCCTSIPPDTFRQYDHGRPSQSRRSSAHGRDPRIPGEVLPFAYSRYEASAPYAFWLRGHRSHTG